MAENKELMLRKLDGGGYVLSTFNRSELYGVKYDDIYASNSLEDVFNFVRMRFADPQPIAPIPDCKDFGKYCLVYCGDKCDCGHPPRTIDWTTVFYNPGTGPHC